MPGACFRNMASSTGTSAVTPDGKSVSDWRGVTVYDADYSETAAPERNQTDSFVATYAAGKFRETSKYAAAEAVLNIAVSLMLVRRWGITGVAVGTLFAMTVRMLMTVFYLKRTVLFRPVRKFWKSLLVFGGYMAAVSGIVCRFLPLRASGYFSWFLLAFETGCIAAALLLAVCLLFYRAEAREILGRRPGRKKS